MTKISDMTPVQVTAPTGMFAPVEKTGSTTNYRVDLAAMSTVTPQMFGAVADGVTDDYAAFAAALAYLAAFALNNGSAFYNGSPSLFIPAGKYRSSAAIDVTHTLIIEGEGSGQFGPGSFGCSHIKFDAAADGFRFQAADTSGNTAIVSPIHNGSGGAVIRDLCLEGGFNGTTESDHHGLVIRNAIKAERLYLKNWPGEGVKAWAGNVTGQPNVSGNVSTTMLVSVKTEGCRGGIDIRGSDANVVTTINCEGYQNRWFGLLDDNGAGSNTHIGMHCASNGVVFGTWPQTQCSNAGNYYAAVWGGDPTVAPSGTTADTANWYYIGVGAPFAGLIPAWVNTPNTFRAGGDYLTLNSAGVKIDNCYSETGGFSQFSNNTRMDHGTLSSQYFRGGIQFLPSGTGDGSQTKVWGNNHHFMDFSGSEAGIFARDLVTASNLSYFIYDRGSNTWFAGSSLNLAAGTLKIAGTTAIDASRNATLAATTATTVAATGAVSGASVAATGAVTGASVAATGAVTGASVAATGAVTSSSASAGVGYVTGAGGAVTQLTSKSTATPTINKTCGQVTMNNAALAAGAKVSFVVTNSAVAATDTVIVSIASGGTANAYRAAVTAISAGVSFTVTVENITAGSLSEAPVVNFAIIKAVAV